jgi:pimeloyl-ACP methyl ester carboxylesterase
VESGGVRLAFEDTETASSPMLLVHGCGLDHSSLKNLADFFHRSYRIISVDLGGHGESDAPHQDYTMRTFADDLGWLCTELSFRNLIVVGHSMGGNIALELGAYYPDLVSMLVMVDSIMLPSQAMLAAVNASLTEAMVGTDCVEVYRNGLYNLCLPSDEQSRQVIKKMNVQQHVLVSAFPNQLVDATPAASACQIPMAYIHSITPLVQLERFHTITPQLVSSKTLGSGHFSPIEVPDHICAMISRFIYTQRTGHNL